jgi:hypothetical protein
MHHCVLHRIRETRYSAAEFHSSTAGTRVLPEQLRTGQLGEVMRESKFTRSPLNSVARSTSTSARLKSKLR